MHFRRCSTFWRRSNPSVICLENECIVVKSPPHKCLFVFENRERERKSERCSNVQCAHLSIWFMGSWKFNGTIISHVIHVQLGCSIHNLQLNGVVVFRFCWFCVRTVHSDQIITQSNNIDNILNFRICVCVFFFPGCSC